MSAGTRITTVCRKSLFKQGLRRGLGARSAPHGFTLIEILVVIAIIGILAAVVVPAVISRPDEARVVAAKQDLATISAALDLYRLDNFSYPSSQQGLAALVSPPTSEPLAPNWKPGGYLKRLPEDPWGRPYIYSLGLDGFTFEVLSYGADGQPGGEGFASDLSSKGL